MYRNDEEKATHKMKRIIEGSAKKANPNDKFVTRLNRFGGGE